MTPLAVLPQPRDIPLPLPADPVLLQALLVVLFLVHILFVNLMVGGSLLTLWAEWTGRRDPARDALARAIGRTITVNKSLAVVLGVGPLLAINLLYTVYFYSANALTGAAWIMVVPLVTTAFLATYAHKYTWDRLARRKWLHLALGALASLIFLTVPFIFLANINLMLFPARWGEVRGFLSALVLPNALPRYLHFVAASVSLTALYLLFWFTRPAFPVATELPGYDRPALRRLFYRIALGATALQLAFGPLVLFTLPRAGWSEALWIVIGIGVTCALWAIALLLRESLRSDARLGRRYLTIVSLITATAFCMGYGRHLYRETALTPHREAMAVRTADYGWVAAAARWREAHGADLDKTPLGERIFKGTCASCHAVDHVLVGPSLQEIARLYAGNPGGIARWADAPGKKRAGFPQMPAFRLGSEKLLAVAEYMLQLGGGKAPAADTESPAGAAAEPAPRPQALPSAPTGTAAGG
ncbi:MAG: c-type cytochrome [Candidatus Krumholzibacteriia bacterium]